VWEKLKRFRARLSGIYASLTGLNIKEKIFSDLMSLRLRFAPDIVEPDGLSVKQNEQQSGRK